MRDAKPFVVYTSPRTGSTWLIDTLASHPAISAHGELLHPEGRGTPGYGSADVRYFGGYLEERPPWSRRLRSLEQIRYLRRLLTPGPGTGAIGLKLMYRQSADNPAVLPYLSVRRARVVHLVRANLLDVHISWQVARATRVFHPREGDGFPRARVSLDPEPLRTLLEHQELVVARERARLERLRFPWREVAYEELVGRRDETLAGILRFLGVDARVELDSTFVRQSGGRSVDAVANLSDVRAALVGTRFEWMLGEAER